MPCIGCVECRGREAIVNVTREELEREREDGAHAGVHMLDGVLASSAEVAAVDRGIRVIRTTYVPVAAARIDDVERHGKLMVSCGPRKLGAKRLEVRVEASDRSGVRRQA